MFLLMVSTPSRNMLKPSVSFPHPQRHQGAYAEIPRIGQFLQEVYSGAAKILRPLTDALKLSPKVFTWSAEIDSAFAKAKGVLISLPTLIHPDPSAPISLASDASDIHIEGALHQFLTLVPRHPYHFSQQSSQQQCRDTAYFIVNRLYHQCI